MLNFLEKSLANLSTEKQRLAYFAKHDRFIRPVPVTVGTETNCEIVNGLAAMNVENVTANFIPMRKTLKVFFELPGVLEAAVAVNDFSDKCSAEMCYFTESPL